MEGSDLVESVAIGQFPIDGEGATEYLTACPPAYGVGEGLYLAHVGATRLEAERLVQATLGKSRLPEPLRLAHLIGQAMVLGESRGRV